MVFALVLSEPTVAQVRGRGAIGAKRSCEYRTGRATRSFVTGSGEPCPAVFPRPRQISSAVPSMAQLSGQSRRGTQTICVYTYLGRRFSVVTESLQVCPLTPNVL